MINENKFRQYGFPRPDTDILGICIHETDKDNMNAQQWFDYFDKESKNSFCYSYVCDDEQILQIMPDTYAVYHTNKGNDWGCRYSIAIAICTNINNEKYLKAQDNCVLLVKQLMEKYNIGKDAIYFHNDFDSRDYCPKTLLNTYGSVKRFVIEKL